MKKLLLKAAGIFAFGALFFGMASCSDGDDPIDPQGTLELNGVVTTGKEADGTLRPVSGCQIRMISGGNMAVEYATATTDESGWYGASAKTIVRPAYTVICTPPAESGLKADTVMVTTKYVLPEGESAVDYVGVSTNTVNINLKPLQ